MMDFPPVEDDDTWADWRRQWHLREGTTYLNHGSFGPPPQPVRLAQRRWRDRLDSQPMDFFFRQFETAWLEARTKLAAFVGTSAENLVFVDNATYAMNLVAGSFPLEPGDEVLLTDHEYGAVQRIWRRACRLAETAETRIAELPAPVESAQQIVDAIFASVSERTRLIVVSHVTSPTAIILPVKEICRLARQRNIAVCIDGPHALAQIPLAIDDLDCDFYTASCHKWLSAPFGSGFLYVHPKHQPRVQPLILSWGRLPPDQPRGWTDEFIWRGTCDPTACLTVPVAIDFAESVGLDAFRRRTHHLAAHACRRLAEQTGLQPMTPGSDGWYGSMVNVPLPPGEAKPLQQELWQGYGIEVPIVPWRGGRTIRVSCHLYNTTQDIDLLVRALGQLLH